MVRIHPCRPFSIIMKDYIMDYLALGFAYFFFSMFVTINIVNFILNRDENNILTEKTSNLLFAWMYWHSYTMCFIGMLIYTAIVYY